MLKKAIVLILSAAIFALPGCSFLNSDITVTDAGIAAGIDDNLMPVKVTDLFPKGTSKVSCWFRWRNAKINTQVLAKWHYVTDDVHIVDYSFNIPKKDGSGGVTLSMPEGKTLPQGSYKVDLFLGKKLLKPLSFKVE
ncbi:MAG: hypothetical protein NTY34_08400 [Candidatus Omnitrophica bacterium]|nr:hypothetical protein [Candidatus Omnitrophota bacterium]